MNIKRAASVTVAGLAAAGTIATAGAGTASALETLGGPGWSGVVLNHDETVLAAQVRAGDLINLVYGDNWVVDLPYESIWYTGDWTPATGHQLVEEAASHPGGQVGFAVRDTNIYSQPFYAISRW
ncbi:hypothetical protein [Prescottella subtropica]|uniref:hypothetical protein n=1 Tax=Prescottella subtropica TaxID=2545757 RepID=UPI0010F5E6AB|nr:hypothetical protein [Prescottella subtropica]